MVPDPSSPEGLLLRLISINEEAFSSALFDVTYDTLMAALHCAKNMKSDQPLLDISRIAKEQLAWIDANYPSYHHSTKSSLAHQPPQSIFTTLSEQALAILKMRYHRKL